MGLNDKQIEELRDILAEGYAKKMVLIQGGQLAFYQEDFSAGFDAAVRELVLPLEEKLKVAVEALEEISGPEADWMENTKPSAICARNALARLNK